MIQRSFLTKSLLVNIGVVIMAILGLGIVMTLTRLQPANGELRQFQAQLAEVRALEISWNADILALQLGLTPNFDQVSGPVRQLRRQSADLRALVDNAPNLAGFKPDMDAYAAALAEKIALAEAVKASHSILMNSASVMPLVVSEFHQLSGGAQTIAGRDAGLANLLLQISTGITSYMVAPSEMLRSRLERELAELERGAETLSPDLVASATRLMAHANIVLRERQHSSELMLAVSGVPSVATLEALQGRAAAIQSASDALYLRMRDGAFMLGGLLTLGLGLIAWQMRSRFQRMGRANQVLLQANEDAQDQLIQSAKLTAMGQMVAGITHEINTPLAYVKTVFELIKEKLLERTELIVDPHLDRDAEGGAAEIEMLIDDGLHGIEEIATLVVTMKNFSRMDKSRIETFSVEEGLDNAVLIARSQLKYVADVVRDYEGVPDISASPSQIKQVFLNLINNAVHALAEHGSRGKIELRTRMTLSDFVKIEIRDNGPGIPEDVLPKIFDPFFTTKPVGEGTGMGLSICYRIIENHGGTLSVKSMIGKGTVFTITLPRRGGHDEEKAAKPQHAILEMA